MAKAVSQLSLPVTGWACVGSESVSLHAEGDRVILLSGDGRREEVDLQAPGKRDDDAVQLLPPSVSGADTDEKSPPGVDGPPPAPPGSSPLDRALRDILQELERDEHSPEPRDEDASPEDPQEGNRS